MASRLILLDANIIITAHQKGIWRQLVSQYKIYIPSTVLRDEAKYFKTGSGQKVEIDLSKEVVSGQVQELEATAEDVASLTQTATKTLMQSLDAGELEAIALLLSGSCKEHLFCTGDTPAIKALGALGAASQGVSFEKLLAQVKIKCGLPGHFSDETFQRLVGQGLAEAHIYKRSK